MKFYEYPFYSNNATNLKADSSMPSSELFAGSISGNISGLRVKIEV